MDTTTFPFSLCCGFLKKKPATDQNGSARPNFVQRMESRIEDSLADAEAKVKVAATNYLQEQESKIEAKIQTYVKDYELVSGTAKKVVNGVETIVAEVEKDETVAAGEVKKIKTEVLQVASTINLKEIPVRPSSSNSTN